MTIPTLLHVYQFSSGHVLEYVYRYRGTLEYSSRTKTRMCQHYLQYCNHTYCTRGGSCYLHINSKLASMLFKTKSRPTTDTPNFGVVLYACNITSNPSWIMKIIDVIAWVNFWQPWSFWKRMCFFVFYFLFIWAQTLFILFFFVIKNYPQTRVASFICLFDMHHKRTHCQKFTQAITSILFIIPLCIARNIT